MFLELRVARIPALILSLLFVGACKRGQDADGARAASLAAEVAAIPAAERALLDEFAGAYPEKARATGRVREFEIVAAEAVLPLIDGEKLKVWAYNGQVPGPTLRVRVGDTVRVRFKNRLPQESTIHWHGIRLPNAMDGVPYLTQPPVEPGGEFLYEFVVPDAGTFWFHPHVRSSEQVERGLYGVLIVEDAEPPPYSREEIWVLDDWRLDQDRQIDGRFNTRHDLAHDGRWGNVITINGRTHPRFEWRSGERIRLRLLNTSNGRVYVPQFPGLEPEIIAVDGLYLREPIPLERFELAPGNRVDLDIRVEGGTSRAVTVIDSMYPRRINRLATIVIDGEGPECDDFPSPARAHVPRWTAGLEQPVTQDFQLNARRGGEFGIEWTINDQAFPGHQHDHPPIATLKKGRWVRLRFTNQSYRLHPMHLHGMFFRLLARNGEPVDEPFFRDTVLVRGRETVDIGVVPTEVGDWMMHCHILEHAEAGMMSTVRVE